MRRGELYVVEFGNHRVQAFAPDRHGRMRFARALGGKGAARLGGQFEFPTSIAVARGMLVVSEWSGERLQVLTPKGVPLQVLTLHTCLNGVCSDDQRVWTAASQTSTVQVLKVK